MGLIRRFLRLAFCTLALASACTDSSAGDAGLRQSGHDGTEGTAGPA